MALSYLLGGCAAFKQQRLFQSDGSINATVFNEHLASAEEGYAIQKFDVLAISVFPNKGEQIVDQTGDYPSSGTGGGNSPGTTNQLARQGQNNDLLNRQSLLFNNTKPLYYTVDEQGALNLPLLGYVKVEGMRLVTLNTQLEEQYAAYYVEPYVISQFVNKRVIVMGAMGEHVIPLQNDGTTLLEVISSVQQGAGASVQSLQQVGKANEIRLIRGMPGQQSVLVIDLTTMNGLHQLQTNIQPDDIVYIPPRRRFDRQALADVSSVFTPILTALTLLTTVLSLTRNP